MKQYNRADFLKAASGTLPSGENPKSQVSKPNEFANKQLPAFPRSSTGLNAYTGTFGQTQLMHLLRRCLFGVSQADYAYFNGKTLSQCLDILLTPTATAPSPPLNYYNNTAYTDPNVPLGSTWVTAAFTDGTANARRRNSFKAWWVSVMLGQDRSLTEKMTLFWHNHFATQMGVVSDARYIYKHHAMLRSNALGNFKTLTRLVTTDPAMLVYLNGNTNTKNAPNENYGRELQELFTCGKSANSLYTEADVKAAARVLTGWKDDKTNITFTFNSTNHDTTDKQFSAFYNNTVITGQTGANGALETDQLIDMIFSQIEVAKYFCRRLYRFFIYYTIDSTVETNVITPLATDLVNNNFDLIPTLRTLFNSEHFFDTVNIGCHIKNPVDHLIGMLRQFNVPMPPSTSQAQQYTTWYKIESYLAVLSQDIGDPPNVAGWPAYYQEPEYHELWINSDTLPHRNLYSDSLSGSSGLSGNGFTLSFDFIAFATGTTNPSDPNQLIADSAALLSANDIGATQTAFLKTILLSNQTADHYWTDAWNLYIAAPTNTTYKNTVLTRLRSMYTYMLELAEYQLI